MAMYHADGSTVYYSHMPDCWLLCTNESVSVGADRADVVRTYDDRSRCASAPLRETIPHYDADGNLVSFGAWSYTYDAASQLVSVSSNGVLLVTNQYDCRRRRVKKITPNATHTFLYDDWNLIHERVDYTNGVTDEFNYYWGRDLSGTVQGAGGVGGLLYLKRNGSAYIPFTDANGNITAYADTTGAVVAEYVYDAFGRTISQSGILSDVFRHRFSSKYFEAECDLYYYGCRFYSIALMRWLSRDPLHEEGGLNLYCFCINSSCSKIDPFGKETMVIKHLPGEEPMIGWARSGCLAETVYKSAKQITTSYPGTGGKIRFRVEINPPLVFIDVYFKMGVDFLFAYHFEEDHISVAKRHDVALWQYKYKTEAINECPREAYRLQHKYMDEFEKISRQLKAENAAYDSPGGKHIINWYPGRN